MNAADGRHHFVSGPGRAGAIYLNLSLQQAYKMKAEEHLLLGIYGAINELDSDSCTALNFNGNSPQNE